MTKRVTLERILRDDDDQSGQSIREWKMEIEDDQIKIRPRDGADFLMIRADDVDQFHDDLLALVSH